MWVEHALGPWCARHGLTLEQGLSVVFRDESYNPQDPSKDLVTRQTVLDWNGQQNDFALAMMASLNMDASTHPALATQTEPDAQTPQRNRG